MQRRHPQAAVAARALILPRLSALSSKVPPTPLKSSSRSLHSSPHHHSSPLFHLASLSNSRESQWFTKASGLSPVEHSPNLQLIRSSEVYPFQPRPNTAARRPKRARPSSRASSSSTILSSAPNALILSTRDVKALGVGREILQRGSQRIARLQRSLRQEKRVSANTNEALRMEIGRLSRENKSATVGILLAVGAATAVATWKTWPANGVVRAPRTGLVKQNSGGSDGAVSEPVSSQMMGTAGRGRLAAARPVTVSEYPSDNGRSQRRSASPKVRQEAKVRSVITEPTPTQLVPHASTLHTGDQGTRGWHSWFWNSS